VKVVILAGGMGTRISEESHLIPKPMIEIGGKPLLWHIMKIYSHYGFNEFIICCGYKGQIIKDYFLHYHERNSDMTVHTSNGGWENHSCKAEDWKITLVDTGLNTMTGSRLKKVQKYVGDAPFMMTYGDGLAAIDILDLLRVHKEGKYLNTLTAVQPPGRYGALAIGSDNKVSSFNEKEKGDGQWMNGGFFVLDPTVFDFIPRGEDAIWEDSPMKHLTSNGLMGAYKLPHFWQAMDTLQEKNKLEALWNSGEAPWKVWND
jgi:glucose-1-phosphate cytidylyltransferase